MCGIIGMISNMAVSYDIVQGLVSLQHRGQDSAGVVTFNDRFNIKKGLGQVHNVFRQEDLPNLHGTRGLGHVRYATQGNITVQDAQPFAVNYPLGLAMVHNGNVINFHQLRKWLYEEHHRLLETSNDLELILYTFASELETKNLKKLTVDDIFDAVEQTQEKVRGAYSCITIIANQGFLVFSDPNGIRPLVMGKRIGERGIEYAFASETSCFDALGFESMRDLEPGEMIFVDRQNQVHNRYGRSAGSRFCIFEYIYFAREDSVMHNRLVASERVRMGKLLARQIREAGLQPDCVIDVPASAYFFASGLAEELNIPYRRGFAKNNLIGRSFISPSQESRERIVRQKLNPIREIVSGKKIAVVDDSIVRGTTSKHIVKMLRDAGAAEVYFVSASPPIKHPCLYGIDMATKDELIAASQSIDDIRLFLGADALIYQSLEDLQKEYRQFPHCDACFSGDYPTAVSQQIFDQIEQERLSVKAAK